MKRRDFWLIGKDDFGLWVRLMLVRTALEWSRERMNRVARALGGVRLQEVRVK